MTIAAPTLSGPHVMPPPLAAADIYDVATRGPSLDDHGVGFAGGGGSSEAYKIAGFIVRTAVNHDVEAVAMHRINHRQAHHHRGDIRRAKWLELARGRKFRSMWFSPDCRDFSKAKQGKPKSKRVRGLAWEVIRCIIELGPFAPDVIFLENVEEFAQWCTLLVDGTRNPWRFAWLFRCFTGALFRRGYTEIQWAPGDGFVYRRTWAGIERVPDVINSGRARDYGAPTIRKRLFLVARRDGKPAVWPEPTHGAPDSEGVKSGRLKPYVTFADIAMWELPCPSIFMTRKQARSFYRRTGIRIQRPLKHASQRRIAVGVGRHVLDAAEPFLLMLNHGGGKEHAPKSILEPLGTLTAAHDARALICPIVAGVGGRAGQSRARSGNEPIGTITAKGDTVLASAFLYPRYGERPATATSPAQTPRSRPVTEPLSTVVNTQNGDTLAAVSLAKLRGSPADHPPGKPVTEPLDTISAGGQHHGVFAAFVAQNNGGQNGNQRRVARFLRRHGVKFEGEFATVTVRGVVLVIVDIGMRMLVPRELYRAQGFSDDYVIDRGLFEQNDGSFIEKKLTGKAQVKMCGNSVSPIHAAAIIQANLGPAVLEKAT